MCSPLTYPDAYCYCDAYRYCGAEVYSFTAAASHAAASALRPGRDGRVLRGLADGRASP